MTSMSLRERVAELLQKSRKALRLYSGMSRGQQEFADLQISEWREINAELLKHLAAACEKPDQRSLGGDVFLIRELFASLRAKASQAVQERHQHLQQSITINDYVRAAALSRELVSLKAREEASQAAHHELSEIVSRSGVAAVDSRALIAAVPNYAAPKYADIKRAEVSYIGEASMATKSEATATPRLAKVIALRAVR